MRKGDVVLIPPGQKHWHGATPDSAMTHIAIVEHLDGKSTEWMEQVSDEQYSIAAVKPEKDVTADSQPSRAKMLFGDIARQRNSPMTHGGGRRNQCKSAL
jgi:4-carboxymuconolactone decarboxylase